MNFKDKVTIKDKLHIAFKCASNPANMVLDAFGGVFGANAMIDGKELPCLIEGSCNCLFQQLRVFSPYVSFCVSKKAKILFNQWKVNFVNDVYCRVIFRRSRLFY